MTKSKRGAGAPPPDPTSGASANRPRPRLLQEDVPGYSLEQALRVPRAIAENYAFKPQRPMNVAGAMGMTPTSGPFRGITGAAVAYGLTTGAAQAPEIGITPLGMRIVRPTAEGDDTAAKRDGLLRPKVVGEFLRSYDGAALPSDAIAKNVLQERGVPAERLDAVLELIVNGAKAVGFIREWGGKRYVDLAGQIDNSEVGSQMPTEPQTVPGTLPTLRGPGVAPPPSVSIAPGIHINIEIHIAADASSETVEDIFRNMRRYVLTKESQPDDEPSDAK